MKILAMADLHAHDYQDFAEPDEITGNSRLTEILKALQYMRKYCLDNGIKLVLDAGDTFHKRNAVNTVVYNTVFEEYKKFSDEGITVVIIPGNHTQVDNSDFPEHSMKPFSEIENVYVLDKFEPFEFEDVKIYPAPYSKNAKMVKEQIENYTKDNFEGTRILLAHLGVSGAMVGRNSYPMQDAFSYQDLRPDFFHFGVLGHYHKPQFIGEEKHYFYCGSPIQHSFNDEGEEHGMVIIDTDAQEAVFHPIPSPKFITVTSPDQIGEYLEGNYVRFRIPAEKVEEVSETIPKELKHRIEPIKEYKEEKRLDVDHSLSPEQVVRKYAEKFKPEAVDVLLEILKEVEQQ